MPHSPVIYLLDDDPSVLKSLGRLLAVEGYAVRLFAKAEEFLQGIARQVPPLVVLDYMMPGLNGLQVQECLREFSADIRVIFISAAQEVAVREQALQAGASAYLSKPFDDELFLTAVHKALTVVAI